MSMWADNPPDPVAVLESRTFAQSPGLTRSPVEAGGADVRVSSAASSQAPREPSPGVAALHCARAAWERTQDQLCLEIA